MTPKKYSIGDPTAQRFLDISFENLEDAKSAAIAASLDDRVIAVWRDRDFTILALIFCGQVFHPFRKEREP